jgi:hypothetical protein
LEVHDWATCPCRGISLDRCGKKLKFNDLNQLLDEMAFYKLNRLQWNGEGALTEAEKDEIRSRAKELGIEILAEVTPLPNRDYLDSEGDAQSPASSRIFLHAASQNGGWLYLKGLGEEDWEAMKAFSERYWRGGDAGEGTVENGLPDVLSPAGSRLANFREKMAVHRERFHNK